MLGALTWWWLWHPLAGPGYQFWSGIGSDLGEITLVGGFVGLYLHHTCHMYGCLRPAWHPDPESGHPVCKRHHPHHPRGGGGLDALN